MFIEPFPSFVSYIHQLNILKHCIIIVFILQENHINPWMIIFELNNKIIPLSLYYIFCQLKVTWFN
jgi:hypothetical protein